MLSIAGMHISDTLGRASLRGRIGFVLGIATPASDGRGEAKDAAEGERTTAETRQVAPLHRCVRGSRSAERSQSWKGY